MSSSSKRARRQRERDEEREVLLFEPRRPRRRSGAGLAFFVFASIFVLALGLAVWMARYWLVDLTIVFSQEPFVSAANIPYWNQPGFPIDPETTAVGSFNWWLFFTNGVDLIPLIYVPTAVLVALVMGFQSLGSTLLQILLWVIIIFQVLKAGYLTFVTFSWVGVSCAANAFCINRDTSVAASTPDITYYYETFSMYFFVVYTILLAIFLPMGYSSAANSVNLFSGSLAIEKDSEDDELKTAARITGDTIVTLK